MADRGSSGPKSKDKGGGKRRGGAGGGGGGDRRNRRKGQHQSKQEQEDIRPVILANPDRNADFPTLQQAATQVKRPEEEEAAAAATSGPKLAPRPPQGRSLEEEKARSSSPMAKTATSEPTAPGGSNSSSKGPSSAPGATIQPERCCKFLEDSLQISENLFQFLTDNTDFFVVGVLGPQGVGKSKIMNELAAKEGLFRLAREARKRGSKEMSWRRNLSSLEKVMSSEHCTTGVNAWVSPQRVIYLDCQGMNSPSVLDRRIKAEKRGGAAGSLATEFGAPGDTVEMHSYQVAGLLLSVCHVVLLVQDWCVDPDVLRMLLTAEMLRPPSPSLLKPEEDSAVVEYFPDLVLVQNKASLEDFTALALRQMREFYLGAFAKSQLRVHGSVSMAASGLRHLREDDADAEDERSSVNLFLLPEQVDGGEEREGGASRFQTQVPFSPLALQLRRQVLSTPRRPLSTSPRQTEKTWFAFVQKTWEAIRSCPYYVEYRKYK